MRAISCLEGRSAVVTGASGAIGRAIAVALAGEGSALCVVGRDAVRLGATTEAVRACGTTTVQFVADLTSREHVKELASGVEAVFGGLDILVHAAGIYARGSLEEASADLLDDQYQANVLAPYRLTQELLPKIADRRGEIVFINSTQGISAGGGVGQFAATQHAMRAIADSLRAEVNSKGVRVTTVHLGRTASERQERIYRTEQRDYRPADLIQPDDVAAVVTAAVALPKRAQITSVTILPTLKT